MHKIALVFSTFIVKIVNFKFLKSMELYSIIKECFSEIFALQQYKNEGEPLYGKGLHKKYS